jgi:uncharacterized protein (TIGR01777 family)
MKIALAGYNGFIGQMLVKERKNDEWVWIPRSLLYEESNALEDALRGAEVVINLAGSSINTRWTPSNKKRIIESRFGVNKRLVEAMNRLELKPSQFITASAIGIYENQGTHDEKSRREAKHFLASVVKNWERPLEGLDPSIPAAILRIGVVLGTQGGALPRFLGLTRWGIVPVMGSGRQMFSFIHIEDLTAAIDLILTRRLSGIFNLCSPNPVDNATFAKSLAKASGAKLMFRIPSWLLRVGLGAAHIMVTEGPEVLPGMLMEEGFVFRFPVIDQALQNLVEKR